MTAYYNEFDPYAAQWLRNLIGAGLIAPGVVDERSICDVTPEDLAGYRQVHLFAGLGGWSAALRLAAWPDDLPVWTGSCPCQPFSAAGNRKGHRDERHLWPVFYDLIRACRPPIVFGEQVASAAVVGTVKGDRPASAGDAPVWFDGVSADLETEGYTVGAAVLGAHSAGAPHIRQRLFWVADGSRGRLGEFRDAPQSRSSRHADGSGENDRLGDTIVPRLEGHAGHGDGSGQSGRHDAGPAGPASPTGGTCDRDGRLGDANRQRFTRGQERDIIEEAGIKSSSRPDTVRSDAWSDFRIVPCRDGKARRVGPSTSVLAHGVSRGLVDVCSGEETHAYSRTGALKGLGNAIVPQVAAEFIRAFNG